MNRKRLLCRVVGHQPRPVRKISDVRAVADRNGDRLGCHRCRIVLPKEATR